jgi:hypothetical protein
MLGMQLGLPNLFFLVWDYGLSTIDFEFCGVSMKGSAVNMRAEELRPLNSVVSQFEFSCGDRK